MPRMKLWDGTEWIYVDNVGNYGRVQIGSNTSGNAGVVATVNLTSPLVAGKLIEFRTVKGSAADGYCFIVSDEILSLTRTTSTPGNTVNAVALKAARPTGTSRTAFSHTSIHVWRGSTDSIIYIAHARDATVVTTIYQTTLGGPQGPAGPAGADGQSGLNVTDVLLPTAARATTVVLPTTYTNHTLLYVGLARGSFTVPFMIPVDSLATTTLFAHSGVDLRWTLATRTLSASINMEFDQVKLL